MMRMGICRLLELRRHRSKFVQALFKVRRPKLKSLPIEFDDLVCRRDHGVVLRAAGRQSVFGHLGND